jgi:hypothetical protein
MPYTITVNSNVGGTVAPLETIQAMPGQAVQIKAPINPTAKQVRFDGTCGSGYVTGNLLTSRPIASNCTVDVLFTN